MANTLFPPKEDGSDPKLCPECKKGKLSVKLGKFGAFLGCSNYPECKYTQALTDSSDEEAQEQEKTQAPKDNKILGQLNEQNIYLKTGPYGWYVQLGEDATARTEKPKRAALPKWINSEEITLEQASILLTLPRNLGDGIEVNVGKFGPYIKQANKSKSLVLPDNIFNITLERAKELLQSSETKTTGQILGTHPKTNEEISLNNGRYGPYIKCGKNNYALPKEYKDKQIYLEDALNIISAKK
jgi:DNA topoisomerase-1